MASNTKYYIAAGGAVVVAAAGILLFTSGAPRIDQGGNSGSRVQGDVPYLDPGTLQPVGSEEASRRATLNDQKTQEAAQQGSGSAVAPPVVADEIDMSDNSPTGQKPPQGLDLPKIQPLNPSEIKVPERVVVRQAPAANPQAEIQAQAERDRMRADMERKSNAGNRVQDQINQLLANNAQPNINIQGYKEPPKPEPKASGNGSGKSVAGPNRGAKQGPVILAAKAGDVFYANLKVGFNSDDPRGLPVFATVFDQRADGSYGPLHGAVLGGNVTYSDNQAAVTFTQMTLRDSRSAPIQAMAATLDEVRPGVATTVNKHTLQRYSGLLVASLLQGAGQAGQQLLENDVTKTISDGVVVIGGGQGGVDWAKVGMAAAKPLGDNLANAFSKSFNRKPTIASPAGTDVGIVFLQQVTIEAMK